MAGLSEEDETVEDNMDRNHKFLTIDDMGGEQSGLGSSMLNHDHAMSSMPQSTEGKRMVTLIGNGNTNH